MKDQIKTELQYVDIKIVTDVKKSFKKQQTCL